MADSLSSNGRLIEWIEDTLTGLDAVSQGRIVGWPAHIREGQKLLVELRAMRPDETAEPRKHEQAMRLLRKYLDRECNPFEPNNQSETYKELAAFLYPTSPEEPVAPLLPCGHYNRSVCGPECLTGRGLGLPPLKAPERRDGICRNCGRRYERHNSGGGCIKWEPIPPEKASGEHCKKCGEELIDGHHKPDDIPPLV